MCLNFCLFFGIAILAVVLKVSALFAGMQKYETITKIKRKQHDKIVLIAKIKLNSVAVNISGTLIDSNISHYELVSVNNVVKEYGHMKNAIKNIKNSQFIENFNLFMKQCDYRLRGRKNKKSKNKKLHSKIKEN